MKNIRRILNLILIIFIVLSTFAITKIFAIESPEMDLTSIAEATNSRDNGIADGESLYYYDLKTRYPLFCREKGVLVAYSDNKSFKTEDGKTVQVDYQYNNGNVSISAAPKTFTIRNTNNMKDDGRYTTTYTYYKYVGDIKNAKPDEAFVLSEMNNNIPEHNATVLEYAGLGEKEISVFDIAPDQMVEIGELEILGLKQTVYHYDGSYFIKELGKYREIKLTEESANTAYASYVQWAWWNTEAGGEYDVGETELSASAQTFKTYIDSVAVWKDGEEGVYDYSEEFRFSEESEIVKGPKINYNPKWKEHDVDGNIVKAGVNWDATSKTYKVGPFIIDYVTDTVINGEGTEEILAGITGCKVVSNNGEINEFEFLHESGEMNAEYPTPNEKFYIVIPYEENLKEIQNIHFDFKYMNAGAKFQELDGKKITSTWTVENKGTPAPKMDAEGNITGYDITREVKGNHNEGEVQDFTYAIAAAKWYKTAELDTNLVVEEEQKTEYAYGDLKVIKNVVDSEGNAISVEKDKIFEFEVTIKRKSLERDEQGIIQVDNDGNYKVIVEEIKRNVTITVPEGQSISSTILPTEIWEKIDGNSELLAPEYIVKEIDPSSVEIENHTYVATENPAPTGKFVENAENPDTQIFEGAVVTVKNIYDGKVNTGKIRIIKEVIDEEGNPKAVKSDAIFKFSVMVGGEQQEVSITVPAGSTSASWTSGEYTWAMNEEAPTYSVDEIDEAGYEKVEVVPQTGSLSANDVVTVVAINKYNSITKKGYIRVIKELVDEEGNPKAAEKDEHFQFNVYINNELKFTPILVINEGQTKTNIWTSDPIEWKEDEQNPTYKVEEVLPIDSTFGIYEIINESGNIVESEPELSQLVAVKNTKEKVIENHGKIKIIKEIIDEKGNLITLDNDVTFKFNLLTYFENEDSSKEVIENKVVEVKVPAGSSSGVWELEETYKWEENVPKYEIKEINVPDNFEFVKIVNENGENTDINSVITGLFKNEEIMTVKAINKTQNKEEHNGKIIIVKKTVDAKGKTFIADRDYEFGFKVEVGGTSENVTLKLLKGTSEAIWESKTYTWEGNVAPTYKVTETNSNGFTPNMTNATGSLLEEGNVTVTAINSKGEEFNKGKIQITKHISGPRPVDGPITFKFDLYVTYDNRETKQEVQITLNENDPVTWTSDYYYWNVDENAPRYRVVETDNGGYQDTTIENDNGYLENEKTISVEVYNTRENIIEYEKGELQIAKILTDGINNFTGKTFEFDVWVEGYGTETVTIEAGNSWAKEYTWIKGEKIPEYKVTEKNASGYNIFSGASGSLVANNTVVVEAVNTFNYENSGSLKIEKVAIIEDKIDNAEFANIPFKFKATIYYDNPNEYFVYEGKSYNSVEIFKEIRPTCGNEGETSGTYNGFENTEIKVYFEKVDNAPKYVIEEIYAPVGWKLISAENEEGKIQKDSTIIAKFTNKLPVERKYIFTMEMGGTVWNDTNYSNGKPLDSEEDGRKNETEAGMPNVIVKIFNTAKDGAQYTLVTDCNGKWSVPNMPVPYTENDSSASYYVTYTYDGQTYQPTKSLVSGSIESFAEANDEDRKVYLDNSMATENADVRNNFNKGFETVKGGNPIDGNGNTIGSTEAGITLNYTSKDVEYNGYAKKDSDLITLNEDGTAKYPMTASTANLGLYYPFDRRTALVSVDREIIEGVPNINYIYHAAYPYLNNVNMGLVERPFADVSIEKELEEAVVVVNGKLYKYKYNEISNTQFAEYPDLLYKQIQINQRNINYTLNLYSSDYYYRASVYQGDNALWTALQSKYINVSDELDLDIYLKYKLIVTNESDSYYVRINQISDYVDSSLELVTADKEKFIDNIEGNKEEKVIVAKAPSHIWTPEGTYNPYYDTTSGWREGSPIKYTRYTTNPLTILGSNEELQLDLTFRVKNALDTLETGAQNCIILGDKNNIAEIDSYSTYYDASGSKVAGRVDEDSAPENINFGKNIVNWYEDDTDISPTIKLGLYDVERNIEGIVWEDAEDTANPIQYNQNVGNGIIDSGENTIGNMTTKLVEKVTIDGKDYDFIWPTGDNIESSRFTLGGKTIYELTGFDSEILTSNEDSTRGKYNFTNVPAGNYVVRFIYGDENTLDLNARDDKGNIKYSGQDYKSTTYQAQNIVDNDNNDDGYIDNEFHELASEQLRNIRVSDARDDESRRLEVISKSQELFYENTSIMENNTSSYGVNNEDAIISNDSLETYYMIANTAKLNMNIESKLDAKEAITNGQVTSAGGIDVNVLNANLKTDNSVKVTRIVYNVNNIDFGLESRSENNIKLDKQIEQITLKTSAGDILIDALYDISYEDDGTAVVELNNESSIGTENLQALNRTPGDLGFRYLNVDKDILQGATITIKYRITALNIGEVDRCATLLKGITDFDAVVNELRQKYHNKDYTSGTYLGQIYYEGATIRNSSKDEVVTTKVKQVVDYVDNDVVFSQVDNTSVNASWANTVTEELENNRFIDKNIIDSTSGKVLDSRGVAYESDSKNNLIVSVENDSGTSLANPRLLTSLTPYDHTDGTNHNAYINLTVSRYYSSNMDIEEVENITETLKLYNDVGRRDLRTIQGNTRPAAGAISALNENDSSATELITLSPPTGIVTTAMLVIEIMAIALLAVTILAGGIVIIKKKVLTK